MASENMSPSITHIHTLADQGCETERKVRTSGSGSPAPNRFDRARKTRYWKNRDDGVAFPHSITGFRCGHPTGARSRPASLPSDYRSATGSRRGHPTRKGKLPTRACLFAMTIYRFGSYTSHVHLIDSTICSAACSASSSFNTTRE